MFRNTWDLDRHLKTCSTDQKFKYNKEPQIYIKPRNLLVELCDYYQVPLDDLYIYDYIIGFDFEAINQKYYLPENPNKVLQFTSKQLPLSFSIKSNLDNVKRFYWSKDPRKLITKLFMYFDKIQEKSKELMLNKLKPL